MQYSVQKNMILFVFCTEYYYLCTRKYETRANLRLTLANSFVRGCFARCTRKYDFYLMTPFQDIGNIPFDVNVLSSIFPNNKHINEKARALEKSGQIVRLKKGMYVASTMETGKELSKELIANHLYGPSYIGREYALRYYGLIPERVYLVTSVTTKHSRDFENAVGHFNYQNCQPEYFHIGIRMVQADRINYLIASPEKALCDVVNFSKNLFLRSMKDVELYLQDDIRFDMDALADFDIAILEKCAPVSRKQGSINTLIKYIKHVRHL